jgi:hypothetical protein
MQDLRVDRIRWRRIRERYSQQLIREDPMEQGSQMIIVGSSMMQASTTSSGTH